MYSVEQLTLGDKSHLMMILYGMAMTHQYLPPYGGSSTIEVEDVNIELPGNVTQDLTVAVNPLQLSNRYGIDLFIDCLNILQSNA